MSEIPLPITSNKDVANDNINAFSINMRTMQSPLNARKPFIKESCSGLSEWVEFPVGVPRAAEILDGSMYVASGTKVYKVETDKSFVEWGDIPNGGIMPSAAGFNFVLFIGEAGEIFLVDEDGVERVEDENIFPASDVAYFQGVFVFLRKDSPTPGEYFASLSVASEGEKISFRVEDFANAETESDPAVAVTRLTDTLAILGVKTVEFFAFGDSVPFPAIGGVFYDVGCAARDTVVKHAGVLYWLASDGTIRQNGQTISTPSVEQAIADAGELEDSRAYVFKERGLVYIAFTFGTSSTWVYSLNGTWDIRQSYNRDVWQPTISIEFAGVQLLGDSLNAKMLLVDPDVENYDGAIRQCVVQTPYVHAEMKAFSIGYIQAILNGSAGTQSVPDPQISMQYSFDGGRTWSKVLTRSMGARGQYRLPVKWPNLGRTQQDVLFRFIVSDDVDFKMIALDGAFTVGR